MLNIVKLMKAAFFVLMLTQLLIGCYTFKPVSKMSDWQLQQEYLDVQYKLSVKQTEYNSPASNTTGYLNNYVSVANQLYPQARALSSTIMSTLPAGEKVKLKDEIATLSKRQSELRLEMSKRGIYSP